MADPVDTDVLRTQALRNQASNIRAAATEAEQDWLEVSESLEAAADEVDRLRAAESRMYADRAQALVSLSKQLDTNAHLLAVIDNAPHDFGCATPAESLLGVDRAPERPCTCWKASIA